MASKHLASKFNKPGFDIVSDHIWCMVGDACLQEGVGLEAISFARHLRFNNMTVIYDNNQITCVGLVSLTNTEDVDMKMKACGWNVINIEDGCFDVEGIAACYRRSSGATREWTFVTRSLRMAPRVLFGRSKNGHSLVLKARCTRLMQPSSKPSERSFSSEATRYQTCTPTTRCTFVQELVIFWRVAQGTLNWERTTAAIAMLLGTSGLDSGTNCRSGCHADRRK